MAKIVFQIFTALLLMVQITSAQTEDIQILQSRLQKIEGLNNNLRTELKKQRSDFEKKWNVATDSINLLAQRLQANEANIQAIGKDLGIKISTTENNANTKIQTLDNTVSKNTLYWVIAVLSIALLSVLLFGLLKRQLSREKTDISDNIQQTKKALEEESIKLDNKLVDLLATQMQLMKEERQVASYSKNEDVNHELALKVADEIIRIQKNLANMDADTKGLKQLSASVKRIQDNFEANGYELVDMLDKPYNEGMNASVTFRPDERFKNGEQIISRIIKPQVNFKGVMIQPAQIEVSQAE